MGSKNKHWKLGEETKRRMSIAKKGIKRSKETKRKISLGNKGKSRGKGRIFTIEHKKNMSNARKGKPMVESAKIKLRNIKVSDETKLKHKMRKHTEETKKKIRESPVIHHINGNHFDNRDENKISLSRSIHVKLHNNAYLFLTEKNLLKEYFKWFQQNFHRKNKIKFDSLL